MQEDMFLSVVMPGYNEGRSIKDNLLIVAHLLDEYVTKSEIIFVDDGSTDNTLEQAKIAAEMDDRIKISTSASGNCGKGSALKLGTKEAKGDYIMFLDSDLDLSPKMIPNFLCIMKEKQADVVIGSKLNPNSSIQYPAIRRFMSFGYYVFLRILFRLNVRDTQTGMKLFKAEAIKPVMEMLTVKGFAFDIEMLAILNRKGNKIADAPVVLDYGRKTNLGRMNISVIWNVFTDTIKIFYQLYIAKIYDKN